ncbi:MAG TPA: UDP-N-acetylmuramoyl-L-alanine--D-glutamate ligase [Clostridiales bacterium]|nr:UDP-N-acetylmuramoyl-L-alanine--D-glutamate ligase [Clostridiales bacterium]
MDIKGKNVLVLGAAVTGIPTALELYNMGCNITLNDCKPLAQLDEYIHDLDNLSIEIITGGHPIELASNCDFIVISPGVPTDIPLVKEAKKLGKEVISEVELAYRMTQTPIAAITGTNGKTTTTALLGEIMKESGRKTFVVGNIGNPIIKEVKNAAPEDLFVLEVSSFQLETTVHFRPKVCAILNITPDHLNRHKTLENYIDAKTKIFRNQKQEDYTVLNWDDEQTRKLSSLTKSKTLFFSRKDILDEGAYVENGYLTISYKNKKERIIDIKDIFIPGEHNLENALAASLMAYCLGVEAHTIQKVLKEFKGVEHRIEYVTEIDGVIYYNDSKGTNPDSSIKAIKTMTRPTILIAGGYDKGSDFDEFVSYFKGKVKALILLGETADKIKESAEKAGFYNIYKVSDMEEAVKKGKELATPGDCVLLSPACASWDMFKNFEERGNVFKDAVRRLRGAE